jgi:mono/diheme cytochrome c family protein
MKLSIPIVGLTLTVALVVSGAIVGTNSTAVLAAGTPETPALAGVAPVQSEGEQLLQARCAVCHDLGGVAEFQAAYDENSLRELVATMISYGAQINDAETDILVAYLLGNEQADAAPAFDETAAANLVNASCTTCHDLTGIERGLYPADEWRETGVVYDLSRSDRHRAGPVSRR